MRTHPVHKLLKQYCYKFAAGLLQLVRFYACIDCTDAQGKLRLNLHSLSVSELLEYRHKGFYEILQCKLRDITMVYNYIYIDNIVRAHGSNI